MANYTDDPAAVALSLLGMGLQHGREVKAIRTQAQLERDKMQFDMAKDKANRKLELDKAMFTLRMDELKQLEGERDKVSEAYTERTGNIPKNPTTPFMELHEASGDISTYEEALTEATNRARLIEDDVKAQRQSIQDIDNALGAVNKLQDWKGGTDPAGWDQGDYDAAIKAAKDKLGVKDFSPDVLAGLEKARPGDIQLNEMNLKLMKNVMEARVMKRQQGKIDKVELMADVQENRAFISAEPRMAALISDGEQVSTRLNNLFKSQDYKDDPEYYLDRELNDLKAGNPLMNLVGVDSYLEGYGASKAAPEFFINKVVTPAATIVKAHEEFLVGLEPLPANATPEMQKTYQDNMKTLERGFFKELTMKMGLDVGTELLSAEKVVAAREKLDSLFADEVLESTIIKYANLINMDMDIVSAMGLEGEQGLAATLDPSIKETILLLQALNKGEVNATKDALKSLDLFEEEEESVYKKTRGIGAKYNK